MLNLLEWAGIVGGALIAGSYLPQIYKLLKTKTARGISTIFVSALLIGSLLLLIYSLYRGDTIFIAINAAASILAGVVLALAVYYKYHENEGSGAVLRTILKRNKRTKKNQKSEGKNKGRKRRKRKG